jgi:hypothetical protein
MNGVARYWHAEFWLEILATLVLISTCLWPYFGEVSFGPAAGLVVLLGLFALIHGCPKEQWLAYTWITVFGLLVCITLLSLFLTIGDDPPENIKRGFYIAQSGFLNAAVAFVVYLSLSRSKFDDVEAAKTLQLAQYQASYHSLLDADEASIKGMDTTPYGYSPAADEKCYAAGRGVRFGSFEGWNKEASTEIGAQLKAAIAGASIKLGEKTQHIVQTYVEQQPGVLLIFDTRLLFFNLQTNLAIPAADIERVLWLDWYLIVVAKGQDKALAFRVPEPMPPWVYAAAVIRAKNKVLGLNAKPFDDG